jgi:putative FmdB family regulatory protein
MAGDYRRDRAAAGGVRLFLRYNHDPHDRGASLPGTPTSGECQCRSRIQKFSDPPIKKCPDCRGGRVEKLMSSPAVHFKGSGWYVTDYARKGSGKKGEGKEEKDAGKKDAGKKDAGKKDTAGDSSSKSASTTKDKKKS